MAKANYNSLKKRRRGGSALILAVVLTSLLAIVGTMFLMSARVNKMSTEAVVDEKSLDMAVGTVIARISQELASDVPGLAGQEYYDYPDAENSWLANLEPYEDVANVYRWQQVSDLDDILVDAGFSTQQLQVEIVEDYQPSVWLGDVADADGDGVADSRWIELNETTSKGKPIFAAIRVIDNGAMLNANTAFQFDRNSAESSRIDGRSQTQINLLGLTNRDTDSVEKNALERLQAIRCGSEPNGISLSDITSYEQNVVRKKDSAITGYTPFDISDELELRNRFFLNTSRNYKDVINSRIERKLARDDNWNNTFAIGLKVPRTADVYDPCEWFYRLNNSSPDDPCLYDYRHIVTTYNADQIIGDDGQRMHYVKSNSVDPNLAQELYDRFLYGIDPNGDLLSADQELELAQIAANIKDYGDGDSVVSVVEVDPNNISSPIVYGFERPCIYVSELATQHTRDLNGVENVSYAIELYMPYGAGDFNEWELLIDGQLPAINPSTGIITSGDFYDGGGRYHVIIFQDPNAPFTPPASGVWFSDSPYDGATGVDPDIVLSWPVLPEANINYSYDVYFDTNETNVTDANNNTLLWPIDTSAYKGSQPYGNQSYDPCSAVDGNDRLAPLTEYFWRIDDVNDGGEVISSTGVMKFTTHHSKPGPTFVNIPYGSEIFKANSKIELRREAGNGDDIVADKLEMDLSCLIQDVLGERSIKRDISGNRCIMRAWESGCMTSPTLGNRTRHSNNVNSGRLHANPGKFNNVGEIWSVFRKATYFEESATDTYVRENVIGYDWNYTGTEQKTLIDLTDPNVQKIFKYVTAIDDQLVSGMPTPRVKGRININTAPWYVIAQLPWISKRVNEPTTYKLADAIIAYRDKLNLNVGGITDAPDYNDYDGRYQETGIEDLREESGFASIGELTTVISDPAHNRDEEYSMAYYVLGDHNNRDELAYPDLSHGGRILGDGFVDDMEERNLLFARISDLVSVRSDVFTAYILVRAGANGPQKRVLAILDRSDIKPDSGQAKGSVKILAIHPVADAR
ncbi:hypothetical protein ACFL3G_07325 [Planctomycetota bacterium]